MITMINAKYSVIVKLLCLLGLLVMVGCSGSHRDLTPTYRQATAPPDLVLPERPEHFGITLPVPRKHGLFMKASSLLFFSGNIVPALLRIDTGGSVVSVSQVVSADSLIVSAIKSDLDSLSFEPGLVDSLTSSMQLPVLMLLREDSSLSGLITPVDSRHAIGSSDLYSIALSLNGYRSARLVSFPSYYCLKQDTDSVTVPRYVSAVVDLDEAGRPTQIKSIGPSPSLVDQILTAMNWAKYLPAERNGGVVASDLHLAVVLYPEVICPTMALDFPVSDSSRIYERSRIVVRPASSNIMVPPVPVGLAQDLFYPRQPFANLPDTGLLIIRIDTTGSPSLLSANPTNARILEKYRTILTSMRFYPAQDGRGEAVNFTGRLFIFGTDSRNVRVSFDWLSEPPWLEQFQSFLDQ